MIEKRVFKAAFGNLLAMLIASGCENSYAHRITDCF
jgi:hypothetical protein